MNRLTDSHDIDRTTGMAHYSGVAVTLRPEVTSPARAAGRRSRKEREA